MNKSVSQEICEFICEFFYKKILTVNSIQTLTVK